MACGTESPSSPVPQVEHEETLARAVTNDGDAKYARNNEGEIKSSTFIHYGRNELSADRYDKMDQGTAVNQGHSVAATRGAKNKFEGWALIKVVCVENAGLKATKSPQDGHKWHADILLPEQAETDRKTHYNHAGNLARRANWKENPEVTS